MNTIKTIILPSADKEKLIKKTNEVVKLFKNLDRVRNATETLAIRLGTVLLELQTIYQEVYKTKHRFIPWASGKFKRAEKTIQSYMRAARRPEQWKEAREKESQQKYHNPLNRAKNAFTRLNESERKEFLIWLDTVLEKKEEIKVSEPKRHGRPRKLENHPTV
jgi:hypothetical protein